MLLRRLLFIFPPLIFVVLLGVFGWRLVSGEDPRVLPSALLDRPVPEFSLPPVPGSGSPGFSSADLKGGGVKLVNVFASWCLPCRAEHPLITRLAEEHDLPIYGLNWKDKPEAAAAWLSDLGNPYVAVGQDLEGRVGIDWGVGGIPESFLVDGEGVIRYKHTGPIAEPELEEKILPILRELRG